MKTWARAKAVELIERQLFKGDLAPGDIEEALIEAADRWEPIETAPRDGTVLWLVEPGETWWMTIPHQCMGMWVENRGYSTGGFWSTVPGRIAPVMSPTHWRPLPEPPK